ncbi:hypothetical protein [Cohnella sp. GCM10027633]|uniref:hypothetical protein n=1 Tax=unclassified Cohnella TaxID=2636738 RepID=UPI0036441ED9
MTVKYQIRCSESDIYVLEKNDGYHVTIGSRVNPLSYGNKIAAFGKLGNAVDAAEQFCRLYTAIKAHGYHLERDGFCKEGMPTMPVLELLALEMTDEAFEELLRSVLPGDDAGAIQKQA